MIGEQAKCLRADVMQLQQSAREVAELVVNEADDARRKLAVMAVKLEHISAMHRNHRGSSFGVRSVIVSPVDTHGHA